MNLAHGGNAWGTGNPRGRMRTVTRAELAQLLGVRTSELGRLGRHRLYRRLGLDRYLLDDRRSASYMSAQNRALLRCVKGPLPAIPVAAATQTETGPRGRAISLGLAEFYLRNGGLRENSVNIINVPDLHHAALAAGMFIAGGLQLDEHVAVVSFEHPKQLFSRLTDAGLYFSEALQNEQLIYLYYKPDVAHSLSLSVDYQELFREVTQLGGEQIKRLVLFNVDALINTNSEHLVQTSLHQLIYAAQHFQITLLGLFVPSGHAGEFLDDGCRNTVPGYFVMN
jgi:hypothetical protein